MDKRIKRIFRRYVKVLTDPSKGYDKAVNAFTVQMMIGLYSEIFDLTYDEAAAELHEGDGDDEA